MRAREKGGGLKRFMRNVGVFSRDAVERVPGFEARIDRVCGDAGAPNGRQSPLDPLDPVDPSVARREIPVGAIELGASPAAIEAFRSITGLEAYPDGSSTRLREAIGSAYGLDPARILNPGVLVP